MNLVRIGSCKVALLVVALFGSQSAARAEALPSTRAFGAASCVADVGTHVSPSPASAATSTGTPRGVIRRAAQVTRNESVDITFEVRPSASGGIEVSARTGELQIAKTVQSSGEFVLELASDGDKVTIAVSGRGTTVSRGKSSVELPRAGGETSNGDKIRRLLADSGAVLQFRATAAALIDAEDRTPAGLAVIMADATVGMLTGDVGAPRRIARFLARRANARLRPVGMAVDCFTVMEERMVEAWNDYIACYISVSPWTIYQEACAWRWTLQVESYWFSFLSCSGFNW